MNCGTVPYRAAWDLQLALAEQPPARAAVGVAGLPKGALVEVDAVVAL